MMPVITGKTSKQPDGPYHYWTIQPPDVHNDADNLPTINLTNREVTLIPGNYELFWQFQGSPSDKLEFSLRIGDKEIAKVSDQIVKGHSSSSGWKTFVVAAQ